MQPLDKVKWSKFNTPFFFSVYCHNWTFGSTSRWYLRLTTRCMQDCSFWTCFLDRYAIKTPYGVVKCSCNLSGTPRRHVLPVPPCEFHTGVYPWKSIQSLFWHGDRCVENLLQLTAFVSICQAGDLFAVTAPRGRLTRAPWHSRRNTSWSFWRSWSRWRRTQTSGRWLGAGRSRTPFAGITGTQKKRLTNRSRARQKNPKQNKRQKSSG